MFKDTPEGATSFCEACEETANHILTKKNHTCGQTPPTPSRRKESKKLNYLKR